MSTVAKAVRVILVHVANRSKHGRWFITIINSDDVIDTLSGFVDLPYNDFVLLLEEAGLVDSIPSLRHRAAVLTMTT